MRVRIEYVVTVDDRMRRAINHRFGKPGLATREDIKEWYRQNGGQCDDDVGWELDQFETRRGHARTV